MKFIKNIIFVLMACGLAMASNMPLSTEASFMESYSASEVVIKATGLGKDEDVRRADRDLIRSAVYFLLYNGTDPMLNTPEAKARFENIKEKFFDENHIRMFISWEADKVISQRRTKLPNGDEVLKRVKMVRVNTAKLREALVKENIILSVAQIKDDIGLPFIMVIPESPKGQTPIEVLDKNPLAKHAAATIESYLTAKKYDVVVPRAAEQLNSLNQLQLDAKGIDEDMGYQLALSLGSDIYITFAGEVVGGKASVSVKAYETTTARLLGTETGYSATRPGTAMQPLVEEAVGDAINKVLQRITNYWIDDLKKGLQYKVIFNVTGSFSEDEIEAIQEDISILIDEEFAKAKENIVSAKTMDYLVWARNDEFKRGSQIYRFFKKKMAKRAKIKQININRKLLILGIENP